MRSGLCSQPRLHGDRKNKKASRSDPHCDTASHYSSRTGETYVGWIKRFIAFHNKRHPAAMGADE